MTTPTSHAVINLYGGDHPNDLNQLLGTHGVNGIFEGAAVSSGLTSAQCDSGNTLELTYPFAQPFQPGSTEIDRVELPLSISSGVGADVLVSLYATSGGAPTGTPLARTLVPKEALGSQVARWNGIMTGPWNYDTNLSLPQPENSYNFFATCVAGGYLIASGGWNGTVCSTQAYSAAIGSSTVGTWTPVSTLPTPVYAHAMAGTPQEIILVGGGLSSGPGSNGVYTASLDSGGNLSGWIQQTNYPLNVIYATAIVVGPATSGADSGLYRVYVTGGAPTTIGIPTNAVYSAVIQSGGSLGAWRTESVFPTTLWQATGQYVDGWIVIGSGMTGTTAATSTAKVYGARVNPDNTIGPWIAWPSLPAARNAMPSAVINNALVFASGFDSGGSGTFTVYSLTVDSHGPSSNGFSTLNPALIGVGTYPNAVPGTSYLMLPGFGGVGASAPALSLPTVSVPLRVTGLNPASVYALVISSGNEIDSANRSAITLFNTESTYPVLYALDGATWINIYQAGASFGFSIPLQLYGGTAGRLMHAVEDVTNTQPQRWTNVSVDYWGKPQEYTDVFMPQVNLLDANTAAIGVASRGTTAGWTPANATTAAITTATPFGGPITNFNTSTMQRYQIGQPTYPLLESLDVMFALQATANGVGSVTLTTTSGFAVTASIGYTASAWLSAVATQRSSTIALQWFDVNNTLLSTTTGSAVNDPVNSWVQVVARGTAPANATSAKLLVTIGGTPANNEVHLLTAAQLSVAGPMDTVFFVPGYSPATASRRVLSYSGNGLLQSIS